MDFPKGMSLEAAVDATLMKLSDAKPGDVLILRSENPADAHRLSRALSEVRLPSGTLPKGGIQIVIAPAGVEWAISKQPETK